MIQIGSKIKGFRMERGLSTTQVADVLGVSESTYRRFETNKSAPDINAIDKMSQLFEKPVHKFFPERIQQHNHQQVDGTGIAFSFGATINQLSDKLIEKYEEQIIELKKEIFYWKSKAENPN